ncbi:MAG: DeoR/GlpR family DNA-binding transcription regulator [Acidihalobacter sp.]|uniref:DeoR/GlpR family DNA-binding transcription regulator n=1 Tax=Acidihalobacter sp. TaxID=1872108 RepID=UPI00307F292F
MPKVISSALLPGERRQTIMERLQRSGRVLASELAAEMSVSEDMIRRDLRELSAAGLCQRIYGGALLSTPTASPLSQRTRQIPERKRALAERALALIEPCQIVFMDSGSTNLAIASILPSDAELTVVTNAPAIAAALTDHSRITLLLLGGRVLPGNGAAVGAATVRNIRRMRADLCLLGACGLDPGVGVTTFDPDEADVKRAFVDASTDVAVAATNDKLGTAAPFVVARADRISQLVVEADAPRARAERFEDLGIGLLAAAPVAPR